MLSQLPLPWVIKPMLKFNFGWSNTKNWKAKWQCAFLFSKDLFASIGDELQEFVSCMNRPHGRSFVLRLCLLTAWGFHGLHYQNVSVKESCSSQADIETDSLE